MLKRKKIVKHLRQYDQLIILIITRIREIKKIIENNNLTTNEFIIVYMFSTRRHVEREFSINDSKNAKSNIFFDDYKNTNDYFITKSIQINVNREKYKIAKKKLNNLK